MVKDNVLITGGAGYIGSVLTGYLLDSDYNVTVLDNLSFAQKSLMIYAHNPNFNFVFGDSRNEVIMKELVAKSDIIIPLAAVVGMPACDRKPEEANSLNTNSITMLDKIRSKNQKLIYPNTNSGYGTKSGEFYCNENTPLEPISIYGKTKCASEIHLLNSPKEAITLRLATVFGTSPRMRLDLLVNDFVLKAQRDGYIVLYEKDFKRNFVHIRDVSRVFEHSIENYESMKGRPYNVGLDDANLSKLELAEKVKEYYPNFEIVCIDGIGKDPDKRNYIVSNERLLSTGFKTKYSLDFGIKELKKAYDILLKNDPLKNV